MSITPVSGRSGVLKGNRTKPSVYRERYGITTVVKVDSGRLSGSSGGQEWETDGLNRGGRCGVGGT